MSTSQTNPAPASSWQTIAFFAVVAAAVFFASRFVMPPRGDLRGVDSPAVGKPAPDVAFAPLTAPKAVGLADQKGKVVLINFWADWCGPCKIEFPHLVQVTERYLANPEFVMVSVNASGGDGDLEEIAADTKKFLTEYDATFPTFLDDGGAAFDSLLKTANETQGGIPLTVIVGKQGKIAGFWMGYVPGDEESVAKTLASALEAKPGP